MQRILLAIVFLACGAALADPVLPSAPGILLTPSSAPSTGGGGTIGGTCGTVNAIAYFSAATTLTCNASFLTDGAGRIRTADGTTAAPAYSFVSDTTLGMFKDADPNFASEALIIVGGSTNDVLIGVPAVYGTAGADFVTISGTLVNATALIANQQQDLTAEAVHEEWCNSAAGVCGLTIFNTSGSDTGNKRVTLASGTLSAGTEALNVTGTINAAASGRRSVELFSNTSAGSAANSQIGFQTEFLAGYTGNQSTFGFISSDNAVGTGTTDPLLGGSGVNKGSDGLHNVGAWGQGSSDGAVTNIGVQGNANLGSIGVGVYGAIGNPQLADNGERTNSLNYAMAANAATAKNAASTTERHIGLASVALNGDTNIAGYFGLVAAAPNFTTLGTAGLIVDNGAVAAPIFITEDNGTATFTVGDGGNWTSTQATWTVSNDMNVVLSGGVNGWSFDGTTFSVDATNNWIGIRTAAPDSALHIAAGTLASSATEYAEHITATLNSSPSATAAGFRFDITSAGSAAQAQRAGEIVLEDGYSGASAAQALIVFSLAGSTDTNSLLSYTANPGNGTIGANFLARHSGAGNRIGAYAQADTGTTANVGVYGRAETESGMTGYAAGVIGIAQPDVSVSGSIGYGGYFVLNNITGASLATTSAALVADNGTVAADIFSARDNATAVFTIADAGNVTFTGVELGSNGSAANPTYSFANSTHAGMFRHGADQIGWSVNSTELLVLTTTIFDVATAIFEVDGHINGAASGSAVTDAATGSCTGVTVTGTDLRGRATATCTATQTVVINFGTAYATAPFCVAGDGMQATTSTTQLTLTALVAITASPATFVCMQ